MPHHERDYIKSLMATQALSAKRSLGQNFLVNESALDALLQDLPLSGTQAIELGAGLGSLSERLAQRFSRLKLIEIDQRLIPFLHERFKKYGPQVEIYEADLLSFPFDPDDNSEQTLVFGNLPYYLTQPSLERLVTELPKVAELRLVLQEEAIARVLAGPGSKSYGPINVLIALGYEIKVDRLLPPHAFFPPPHVRSQALFMRPRRSGPLSELRGGERAEFLAFVQFLFSERRKILRQILRVLTSEIDSEHWATARAESLTPEDFWALYQSYGSAWQKRGLDD